MRADIVMARAAAAHAAWHDREEVNVEDLRAAARLALPHRRRRNPFDAPGLDDDELDELLPPDTDDGPDPDTDPDGPGGGHGNDDTGDAPPPGAAGQPDPTSAPADRAPVGAGEPYKTRLFTVRGVGDGHAGRRSRARTTTGRRTRSQSSTGSGIHLVETVRAAAPHQAARGRSRGRLLLRPTDLRRAVREGREANLVVFVVDTSGSMAARERMHQVKTAILSLLLDAYRRRDRVGVVTFRNRAAEIALPPTGSVDIAAKRLADLPAGGRTPLAEGLMKAVEVVRRERLRDPSRRPLLVIVTDGRATAGPDAIGRSRQVAAYLANEGIGCIVVDCESGRMRMGLAATLAQHLNADYVPLGHVNARALTDIVRGATSAGAA
jgi:magnesium chelatase subunit D